MPDDSTLPPAQRATTDGGASGAQVPVLVILGSAEEPHRVGEVAPLPDIGIQYILGRGEGDGRDVRAPFGPWTPNAPHAGLPLADPCISARQTQFTPNGIGFVVTNLGQRELRIGGEVLREGLLPYGQTAQIGDQLLLRATTRPARMHLRNLDLASRGTYGRRDRVGFVGHTPELLLLLDALIAAARTGRPVLLHGETGAGKDVSAMAFHALSARAHQAFIAVNVSAIPPSLLEAEIFGLDAHYLDRGMPERIGFIGQAEGGILFLDEIGRLNYDLQGRLLRIMDRGATYHRAGDPRPRTADIFIIAATNAPLDRLAPDVLARFGTVIELPTLRLRADDIPLLVQYLAMVLHKDDPEGVARFIDDRPEHGRFVRVELELIDALMRAPFLDNVRGLENALRVAMRYSKGSFIRRSQELSRALAAPSSTAPAASPYLLPNGQMRKLTEEERAKVRAHITQGGRGTLAAVARRMGVSRDQLGRALKMLDIALPPGDDDPED